MMWWIFGMLFCMAMMVMMMRHGMPGHTRQTSNRDEDAPESILTKRLASGEIDVEEYERLRDALQRTSKSTADAVEPSPAERHSPTA